MTELFASESGHLDGVRAALSAKTPGHRHGQNILESSDAGGIASRADGPTGDPLDRDQLLKTHYCHLFFTSPYDRLAADVPPQPRSFPLTLLKNLDREPPEPAGLDPSQPEAMDQDEENLEKKELRYFRRVHALFLNRLFPRTQCLHCRDYFYGTDFE
ncbi:MAG: hypothetical protein M1833_001679 [Piccolia ochrophora]|nr:MAG: hypothetical protein M1833_001679 [Piccolia ochrophora]